jgi:hypothetical protein
MLPLYNNSASQQRNLDEKKQAADMKEKKTMLSIAYHNLAVEHEFLGRQDVAVAMYRRSLSIMKIANPDSPMVVKFSTSLKAAQKALASAVDDGSYDVALSTGSNKPKKKTIKKKKSGRKGTGTLSKGKKTNSTTRVGSTRRTSTKRRSKTGAGIQRAYGQS